MDDAFGHWLAGFVDGEGCFTIRRVTSGKTPNNRITTWPNCVFEISLRADDQEVLKSIQAALGFGSIGVHTYSPNRPNEMTAVRFTVHRIDDCLRLVEHFQRYPLRAKKRVQFEVWADAVHEMAKGKDRSDEAMEAYRARLRELRLFVAPVDLAAVSAGNPPVLKHRRNYGEPPLCMCGCGNPTKIVSCAASLPHPSNPNYSAHVRGHCRRTYKLRQ